ncbi:MAG: Glucose-methanol-choline (GMC) oxidoreductase:NAD binding site, partial [uncultured Pseudonocardia sp.]
DPGLPRPRGRRRPGGRPVHRRGRTRRPGRRAGVPRDGGAGPGRRERGIRGRARGGRPEARGERRDSPLPGGGSSPRLRRDRDPVARPVPPTGPERPRGQGLGTEQRVAAGPQPARPLLRPGGQLDRHPGPEVRRAGLAAVRPGPTRVRGRPPRPPVVHLQHAPGRRRRLPPGLRELARHPGPAERLRQPHRHDRRSRPATHPPFADRSDRSGAGPHHRPVRRGHRERTADAPLRSRGPQRRRRAVPAGPSDAVGRLRTPPVGDPPGVLRLAGTGQGPLLPPDPPQHPGPARAAGAQRDRDPAPRPRGHPRSRRGARAVECAAGQAPAALAGAGRGRQGPARAARRGEGRLPALRTGPAERGTAGPDPRPDPARAVAEPRQPHLAVRRARPAGPAAGSRRLAPVRAREADGPRVRGRPGRRVPPARARARGRSAVARRRRLAQGLRGRLPPDRRDPHVRRRHHGSRGQQLPGPRDRSALRVRHLGVQHERVRQSDSHRRRPGAPAGRPPEGLDLPRVPVDV